MDRLIFSTFVFSYFSTCFWSCKYSATDPVKSWGLQQNSILLLGWMMPLGLLPTAEELVSYIPFPLWFCGTWLGIEDGSLRSCTANCIALGSAGPEMLNGFHGGDGFCSCNQWFMTEKPNSLRWEEPVVIPDSYSARCVWDKKFC